MTDITPVALNGPIDTAADRTSYIRDASPYFLGFVCLGIGGASFGPALPHLAQSTGVSLSAISSLFVAHRIGFVLGALGAGRLYDRVRGHAVFSAALLVMAAALTALPSLSRLSVLLGVGFVAGFMAGGVDVGGNVLLVWRVRKGLGPYMSFLHFAFGVGTFLAPVFLAQSVAWTGGIQWGYVSLALLTAPIAVLALLRPSPKRAGGGSSGSDPTGGANQKTGGDVRREGPNHVLVGLAAVFLLLYVAAEVGFGNWIYTYAIELGLADEVTAGYLTSAYWGAYTIGRLGSVAASARLRPFVLLAGGLALASASVLMLWIAPAVPAVTWIATILVGAALAPMFPVMVTFAGERTAITGGVTSLFLVGASLGAMSLPWLIGQAFGRFGPRVVPAAVFFDLLLLIGVLSFITIRFGRDRNKLAENQTPGA